MQIGRYNKRPITRVGLMIGGRLGRRPTIAARGSAPTALGSSALWLHALAPSTNPHGLWSAGNGGGGDAGKGGAGHDDHPNSGAHHNDDHPRGIAQPLMVALTGGLVLLCVLGLAACSDGGSQNFPPEEEPPQPDTQGNNDVANLNDTAPAHAAAPTADIEDDLVPADANIDTNTDANTDTNADASTDTSTGVDVDPDTADGAGDAPVDAALDAPEAPTPASVVWCTNTQGNECLTTAALASVVATTLSVHPNVSVHYGTAADTTVPFSADLFLDIDNGPIEITVASETGTMPTALAGAAHSVVLTAPLFITDEGDPDFWADNNAARTNAFIWTTAQGQNVSLTAGTTPDPQQADQSLTLLHLRTMQPYSVADTFELCTAIYFHPCLTTLKPVTTP